MKKLIFIWIMAMNIAVSAQEKTLPGFWGIKFGSSYTEVMTLMEQKKECRFAGEGNSGTLIYSGGKFAGENIEVLYMAFHNGKFFKAICALKPYSESSTISTFNTICEGLSSKYDSPDKRTERYQYPYEKGDGFELQALKSDHATIAATWDFVNADIIVLIDRKLNVALFYEDKLVNQLVDEKKRKDEIMDL